MYTHIHTHCTHMYTHIHTHCTHMYTHIHTHCTHIHTHTYTYTHIGMGDNKNFMSRYIMRVIIMIIDIITISV